MWVSARKYSSTEAAEVDFQRDQSPSFFPVAQHPRAKVLRPTNICFVTQESREFESHSLHFVLLEWILRLPTVAVVRRFVGHLFRLPVWLLNA